MPREDCILLDQPAALRVMFYPRGDFSHLADNRDVFFEVEPDVRVGSRLHVTQKDSPLVLLFHGNGEIASDYDDLAPLFMQIGVSLLVVDYRGYGKSDGTPTASDLLDDAADVNRQLREVLSEKGVGDYRLYVMGRSLGSAAALEIASHAGNISGLIIESGFASALGLIQRLGGSLPDGAKEGTRGFDNIEKIRQVKFPTLIIHGEKDFIIPVSNGKALYENCGALQKRLVTISGAGHNDLLYRGQDIYFSAIRTLIFG